MLDKKLSIIVPIYNVEHYLRKCVESLLAQDIQSSEYEIILVDDGSPDECPQMCDEYAATHSNIKVIHRENGGLSAARNSGIEMALGEYIMFVDSDDYIEPDVLSGLLEQIDNESLDVLRYDYQNVNDQYRVFNPNKAPRQIDKCSAVVDGMTYLNTRMGYACYAWQWIIRKSIVSRFTESIHFEDVDWLPRMMLRAKRVNSTTTIVYNYLWREGSITLTQGKKDKIKKNVEDEMYITRQYGTYYAEYTNCIWLKNMQGNMAVGVLTMVAREFYKDRKEYIYGLREMNVFPLSVANHSQTYVRRARIINRFGPHFYCLLMRLRRVVLN